MSLELIGFVVLSVGMLSSAAFVVFARNPLYGALSMILSFFFMAGLYVMLHAGFLAVLQILVYAGAIMVLFLFVVMLLNLQPHELGESRWNLHKVVAVLAVVGILLSLGSAMVVAFDRYLDEPAISRSENLQRLSDMAQQASFDSQEDMDTFYADMRYLRTMAYAKLALRHGSKDVQIRACSSLVAQWEPSIDEYRCDEEQVRTQALAIASTATDDFDQKLLELQSRIDTTAIPAEWQGQAAKPSSGLAPSPAERAILHAVELIFARRIDQLSDALASSLLDEDTLAAYTKQRDEARKTDKDTPKVPPYGQRLREARDNSDALAELAKGIDDKGAIEHLVKYVHSLGVEARVRQGQVLSALRSGDAGRARELISKLASQNALNFASNERERLHDVLRNVRPSTPSRQALIQPPALPSDDEFGSVRAVGTALFTRYLLAFEVMGVLLLVAVVGSVVLAKRRSH
ncbi:MAG: NADH-quinone oxidoreductase subunit J [Myxococcota bacterium]|jgi:NADH:ubiquinone oxidoreductase subunit 6 (subunit J)|nr:NADH-quinone oxidoreductase subunit J [Myxococcota bacterium]